MNKKWIYHKTQKPQIILQSEYDKYNKEGWFDSPIAFINFKDMPDLDIDNHNDIQMVGEMVDIMKDMHNWILNIEYKTVSEMKDFTLTHFKHKLKVEKKSKMILKIKELLKEQNEQNPS